MTVSGKNTCPTQSGSPGLSLERCERWMQTVNCVVYAGSRLEQLDRQEGTIRQVSLEAVTGKTHRTEVRPANAGMFSGRAIQSHRGKSQSLVAR